MSSLPHSSSYTFEEEISKSSSRKSSLITNKKSKKKYFLIQYLKLSQIEINELRLFNSIKNNSHLINCKEIIYSKDDKTFYCITDYSSNLTLHHLIIQSPSSIKEELIWQILTQVLYGVLYLHNNGFVHRSIKSSHIYLNQDYSIAKVGGFKLCEMKAEETAIKHLPASLNYFYSAPEIMNNEPYDFSSDVWSIGACLYEMCFKPWEYKQPEVYFNMIKGIIQPIRQEYSSQLNKIILSMLSLKPSSRPTCAQLLNNAVLLRNLTNIHHHINCISQSNEQMPKVPFLKEINEHNLFKYLDYREYSSLSPIENTQVTTPDVLQAQMKIISMRERPKTRNNSSKSAKTRSKNDKEKYLFKDNKEQDLSKNLFTKKMIDIYTSSKEINRTKILFNRAQQSKKQISITKSANTFSATQKPTSPKENYTYCTSHPGFNRTNRPSIKHKNLSIAK